MPNSEISSFSVPIIEDGTTVNVTYNFKDSIARSNMVTVDSNLDSTSQNPVQNKVIKEALDNKVDKVSGKGLSTEDYTTAEKTKLAGIASGAAANVQSDWNQTDSSADDFIKNKPTVPTVDQTFDATSPNAQSGVAIASVLGGSSKFDILYTGSFNSAGNTSFTSAHPYSDYDIIFILIVDSNSRNNILGAMLGGTNVPSFTQTVLDQTSSRQTKCTVISGRAMNEVTINRSGSIEAEYTVNIIGIKV